MFPKCIKLSEKNIDCFKYWVYNLTCLMSRQHGLLWRNVLAIIKTRLSDQVFEEIKKMIREESFSIGDKFYSENELTRLLSVSRSSVREAVRILELSGLVDVIHGKGIFIADPNEKNNQNFADWLRKNEASLEEHFEIRLIIDPKTAAYAALKAEEDDILKLKEICRQFNLLSESGTTSEIIRLDEKFHLQLAKAAKNRTLYMMMKTMTQSLPVGWISSLQVPGRIKKTIKEHCAIVDAVISHDSKAAEKKMEEHIKNALKDIRNHIAESGGK